MDAMAESKRGADSHEDHNHVVPLKVLAGVWGALLVLTWITVTASWIDLGNLNIVIALAIAVVKSAFVALYFMHLRYDKPFNAVVLVGTLCFVVLFIGLAMMDVFHYRENVDSFREQHPERVAPQLDAERARLQEEP